MAEHQALLLPTEEVVLLKTTTVVIIQTEDQATQLPQLEAITIIATTHQEAIHHQPLPVHTIIVAVVEA